MEKFTVSAISNDLGNRAGFSDNNSTSTSSSTSTSAYVGNAGYGQFFCYSQDQNGLQVSTITQNLNNSEDSEKPEIVQRNSNSGLDAFDNEEQAAKSIEDQIVMLCDDNDLNDEDTIKMINDCLKGLVCVKEFNGEKYIA